MKLKDTILIIALIFVITGCSKNKLDEKGFQVASAIENSETGSDDGLDRDSLKFETRPSNVLETGIPNIRITTIYKVNLNKDKKAKFIGSNNFHYRYDNEESDLANNWNGNLMPGITSIYGYNLVNVSHYDIIENKQKYFFDKPVLIKTLYYPTFSNDTLNNIPVHRNYFIVTVYNEDTNKDGFINIKDLRRMFLFNINGERQKALVPENYSVIKSEYDSANDFMYVFAQSDVNNNGGRDEGELTHIFWIDLKDPMKTGRVY